MEKKLEIRVKKGDLLVSQPFMMDGNFRRTVVFLAEYNKDGALGFILNRPLEYKVEELVLDFPDFKDNAYFGGPVATNTIHYIHRVGQILDESIEIDNGIFWGGNFDKLKSLIANNLVSPNDIKFYVGYSGWSPGQLEDELIHGSWIIAPVDSNYIFKQKNMDLWKKVLEHKGENFEIIAQMRENFFLN
jgi:putative transcriptional regulator